MGREFTIDTIHRLIVSKYFGEHFYSDVVDQWKEMRAHPDFNPDFDLVSDLSGVTRFLLTTDELRSLLHIGDPMSPNSKRIMIATSDYVFGNLRMYGLIDWKDRGVTVVRNWKEAWDLLHHHDRDTAGK